MKRHNFSAGPCVLPKEVLDKFAEDFHAILAEDPEIVSKAPYSTPVKRVDEVWAARNLILRHPSQPQE